MQNNVTWIDTVKHAGMSILIGAIISFLTVLFQASIEWLNNLQPEVPGTVAGIAKYIHSWKTSHLG